MSEKRQSRVCSARYDGFFDRSVTDLKMPNRSRDFFLFLPYIAFLSVFCQTDGAARILPQLLSFYLPVTSINAGAGDNRHCEREYVDEAGYPRGCIWVRTQAASVSGQCLRDFKNDFY